ncbi:hypothetical protein N7490_012171 [Penicillium lividum]|nr:hypothetical protein N7490_012171 [Penicillium lividum]
MAPQNPRSANAYIYSVPERCETCRRRKVKCTGERPCRACIKHNLECVFGTTGRRKYSEACVLES